MLVVGLCVLGQQAADLDLGHELADFELGLLELAHEAHGDGS